MLRPVPQVVMGIDDGEVGIEDRLGLLPGQPRLIRRGNLSKSGRLLELAHVDTPLSPTQRRVCNGFMLAMECSTFRTLCVNTYPSNDTHRPVHTGSVGRSRAHTRRQTGRP